MNFIQMIIVLFALGLISCSHSPHMRPHHDKVKTSLLIKNNWIKVQKIELLPGKDRKMHMGGPRLIVALSDYQILFKEKDSSTVEKSWKREMFTGTKVNHTPLEILVQPLHVF